MSNEDKEIKFNVSQIDEEIEKLRVQKNLMLKKALESDNPTAIVKAQNYLRTVSNNNTGAKSALIRTDVVSNAGTYNRVMPVSYEILRAVGRIPIIKAIIETRIEQISNFLAPQVDKYSPGFIIRKKKTSYWEGQSNKELTKQEREEVDFLTEFLLNAGEKKSYYGDTFYTFVRKIMLDSLTFDQCGVEKVFNRGQKLTKIIPVDGSTIRIADSLEMERRAKKIRGYYPMFIQVIDDIPYVEYYPWELAFGVRNVSTDLRSFGYGRSELEDLIQTITNMLNADAYNANYFKIGSNPKGIIRVSGNVNQTRIEELKAIWQAEVVGVQNAHKTPVLEADKIDFINTQTSNKDMEYSRYYEFLIKVTCAIYKIDPSEINFTLNGSSEVKPMFEGNHESRVKYSRDKGLRPLLRFLENYLNRHILSEFFDGKYEINLVGLDSRSFEQEVEIDGKLAQQGFVSQEDMFKKYSGREFDSKKDTIMNPSFIQAQQMKMMGGEESNQFVDEEYGEENPFMKSLESDINKLLQE